MLAIRVSPNKSNLHFVCDLFEYQGLSKERKNYFDTISDSYICEINKQNSFSLVVVVVVFFLPLNQSLMPSPRASQRQSVTVNQLVRN